MLRSLTWIALAAALFWRAPAVAAVVKPQALDPGSLAGVWLIRDKKAPKLRLELMVLSGESDNTGPEGLAHYLEHLVWRNVRQNRNDTRTHGNAYTRKDHTGYFLVGPPAKADAMLRSLRKVFDPIVQDAVAEREVAIVNSEYNLRAKEGWQRRRHDAIRRRLHADHPYGRSVIGTPSSIAQFSAEAAAELHRQTHRRQNSVLLISGDIGARAAQKLVRGHFGKGGESAVPAGVYREYRMADAERLISAVSSARSQSSVLLYTKLVRLPQAIPLLQLKTEAEMLARILSSRLPGGLSRSLHYRDFLARALAVDVWVIDSAHLMLDIRAEPDKGVELTTLLERIEAELELTAQAGLPEGTVGKLKVKWTDQLSREIDPFVYTVNAAARRLALKQAPLGFSQYLTAVQSLSKLELDRRLAALVGEGRIVAELISPRL